MSERSGGGWGCSLENIKLFTSRTAHHGDFDPFFLLMPRRGEAKKISAHTKWASSVSTQLMGEISNSRWWCYCRACRANKTLTSIKNNKHRKGFSSLLPASLLRGTCSTSQDGNLMRCWNPSVVAHRHAALSNQIIFTCQQVLRIECNRIKPSAMSEIMKIKAVCRGMVRKWCNCVIFGGWWVKLRRKVEASVEIQ